MGHSRMSPVGYRDDPDAVSLHTTPEDPHFDDTAESSGLPPSYVDSQEEHSSSTQTLATHPLPRSVRFDHNAQYTAKLGRVQVGETQTVMDRRYDTDPAYLEEGLRIFANEAPLPLVYIIGNHWETVRKGDKKEKKEVMDFRIVLDLQQYLIGQQVPHDDSLMTLLPVENGEKTYRGTITKCRAPGFTRDLEVGASVPTITEWAHRYCASPRMLRVFRLGREISGLDTEYLKGRIEGIIRSTNYRGRVDISFPIEHRNVDIVTSNWINEWRAKSWVRWIFYLSFLWIFTWPYLFFATKRYSVVRATWPFSKTNSNGRKTYTTVSEEEWFEKWNVGIRRLALDRFQGQASYEMLAGVIARDADPPMPGSIRSGHEGVDAAVGMLTSGFAVARALSRGSDLPRSLNGGWGYDT